LLVSQMFVAVTKSFFLHFVKVNITENKPTRWSVAHILVKSLLKCSQRLDCLQKPIMSLDVLKSNKSDNFPKKIAVDKVIKVLCYG